MTPPSVLERLAAVRREWLRLNREAAAVADSIRHAQRNAEKLEAKGARAAERRNEPVVRTVWAEQQVLIARMDSLNARLLALTAGQAKNAQAFEQLKAELQGAAP